MLQKNVASNLGWKFQTKFLQQNLLMR